MTDIRATSSGIPGIGKVPWGTHLCHFYRTREDLIHSIVPYFAAGLKNRELCFWGTASPLHVDDARAELARLIPDAAQQERQGRLEIFDHYEWYTKNGSGDPVKDLVLLEQKALKAGFKGLRCGGNISWLTRKDCPAFTAYESRVTLAVRKRRILAICSYNIEQCEGPHVYESIRNHHLTLGRRDRDWEMMEAVSR